MIVLQHIADHILDHILVLRFGVVYDCTTRGTLESRKDCKSHCSSRGAATNTELQSCHIHIMK